MSLATLQRENRKLLDMCHRWEKQCDERDHIISNLETRLYLATVEMAILYNEVIEQRRKK